MARRYPRGYSTAWAIEDANYQGQPWRHDLHFQSFRDLSVHVGVREDTENLLRSFRPIKTAD